MDTANEQIFYDNTTDSELEEESCVKRLRTGDYDSSAKQKCHNRQEMFPEHEVDSRKIENPISETEQQEESRTKRLRRENYDSSSKHKCHKCQETFPEHEVDSRKIVYCEKDVTLCDDCQDAFETCGRCNEDYFMDEDDAFNDVSICQVCRRERQDGTRPWTSPMRRQRAVTDEDYREGHIFQWYEALASQGSS